MRTALALALVLVASTSQAATVSLTDTRSHSGATSITGWSMFGTSGPLQWHVPSLDITDVGSVVTMTEANASDYDFDWGFAQTFLQTANAFEFNVGSYLGTDDTTLHRRTQVFAGGGTVQEMRFEILAWESNSISVRGTVQYLSRLPEPSALMVALVASVFVSMLRCRQ